LVYGAGPFLLPPIELNDQQIARWRTKQALGRSYLRRPDLLEKLDLNDEQQTLLDEFLKEQSQ